jgi:hypothetical protein
MLSCVVWFKLIDASDVLSASIVTAKAIRDGGS